MDLIKLTGYVREELDAAKDTELQNCNEIILQEEETSPLSVAEESYHLAFETLPEETTPMLPVEAVRTLPDAVQWQF